MRSYMLALALVFARSVAAESSGDAPAPPWRDVTAGDVTPVYPAACADGVYRQPDGPFAVVAFCDGAHSTHIAVGLLRMGDPVLGKWTLSDRFWQEQCWSSDATAIAWEPGGKRLFISTGAAYGSATVWVLDPLKRSAHSLFAQEPPDVCEVTLKRIDPKAHVVVARLADCTREGRDVELRY